MSGSSYYSVVYDGDGHLVLIDQALSDAEVAEMRRVRREKEDLLTEIRDLLAVLVAHAEVLGDERITIRDIEGRSPGD